MSALEALVPVAVVGTARRALDPEIVAGVRAVADLPPARALLKLAARAAVLDRVTLAPGAAVDDPGPGPETLPVPASPAYLGALHQAIGGQRWRTVGESLRYLAETGQRVPVGVLPMLLREAETRGDLRPDLWPVLGARGRWLASRNPPWGFAEWVTPDPADDRVWESGTPEARVAWLGAVRAADPDRARRAWLQRPPADAGTRAATLAVLGSGLGPSDEPILEHALNDRARNVRDIARELLAGLPDSAYVQRMCARLVLRVRIHQGRWSVDLDRLGPEDARDGLTVDPRERPPGATAVRALTGGVPLRAWPDHLGLPVPELLHLRTGSLELGPLPGLRDAAVREADPEVARAILLDPRWPADPALVMALEPGAVDEVLARRVRVLPPPALVGEMRAHGIGSQTAGALLAWAAENRNHGWRTAVLGALGDCGPLSRQPLDLAAELRRLAGALLSADRARALDAAMTLNLRRALRAEATPTFDHHPEPAEEQS